MWNSQVIRRNVLLMKRLLILSHNGASNICRATEMQGKPKGRGFLLLGSRKADARGRYSAPLALARWNKPNDGGQPQGRDLTTQTIPFGRKA